MRTCAGRSRSSGRLKDVADQPRIENAAIPQLSRAPVSKRATSSTSHPGIPAFAARGCDIHQVWLAGITTTGRVVERGREPPVMRSVRRKGRITRSSGWSDRSRASSCARRFTPLEVRQPCHTVPSARALVIPTTKCHRPPAMRGRSCNQPGSHRCAKRSSGEFTPGRMRSRSHCKDSTVKQATCVASGGSSKGQDLRAEKTGSGSFDQWGYLDGDGPDACARARS